LQAWHNTWLYYGDRSRPAAAEEAVVITGASKTAANRREAVEKSMYYALSMLSIWPHPLINTWMLAVSHDQI